MAIHYSGTVERIRSNLGEILVAWEHQSRFDVEPVPDGLVSITGTDAQAEIRGGAFAVVAEDQPGDFDAYRLKVTEVRKIACIDERQSVAIQRTELRNAQREGLSGQAIRGMRELLARSVRQLEECERRAAPARPVGPLLMFRSTDLYRTGDAREDGLRVQIRLLTSEDWARLAPVGGLISEQVSFEALADLLRPSLTRSGLRLDGLEAADENSVRVKISQKTLGITVDGHITFRITPYSGSDYRKFLSLARVEVDLHGIIGTIAGLFVEEDELVDDTLTRFSILINTTLAQRLEAWPGPPISLTILGIQAARDGIAITAAIGVLLGGRPDPCQSIRNRAVMIRQELANAEREGLSGQAIAAQRAEQRRNLNRLQACRGRQSG